MHKCKKHPCPKPATCKCRKVRDARVPVIWVLGPVGSGKGAQSAKMVEQFGFSHFSTGELLREEVRSGSEKGIEIQEYIDRGDPVPDEDVTRVLERAMMRSVKTAKGYLVDNYPINKEQACLFEEFIAPVDLILLFECTEDTCIQRILNRAMVDGENARADDNEEIVKKRFEDFNNTINDITEPRAEIVKRINAERTEDEIYEELMPIIEEAIACKLANTADPTCDKPEDSNTSKK